MAVLALALGVVAGVSAQDSTPSVTVQASANSLALNVSGSLQAGVTRFEVEKTGGGPLEIAIGALQPGVTVEQFTAALRRGDGTGAHEISRLDGGVSLTPGEQGRAVTFRLRPSSTYV
ncbi:MAG: hypothetical protein ACRDSN_19515, partial [Pseudonocardiaceae bacterium]